MKLYHNILIVCQLLNWILTLKLVEEINVSNKNFINLNAFLTEPTGE